MTWRIKVADILWSRNISCFLSIYIYIFGVTFWTEFTFPFNCTFYFYLKRWISGATTSLSGSSATAAQLQSMYLSHYTQNWVTRELQRRLTGRLKCIFRFSLPSDLYKKQVRVLLRKIQRKLDLFFLFLLCSPDSGIVQATQCLS